MIDEKPIQNHNDAESKADRNAVYLATIDHALAELKQGLVVVKTLDELRKYEWQPRFSRHAR